MSSTGRKNPARSKLEYSVKNKGYSEKPVLDKTVKLLDAFYKPFNEELAKILGDDKWLWL